MQTVPNQRVIEVHKEQGNQTHKYTVNTLEAIDEAVYRLQSKGGFKLYMYLAKNQNNYEFALSSNAFCLWSGLSLTAYRTAFAELIDQGYLVACAPNSNKYSFYDKTRKQNEYIDTVIVDINKEVPDYLEETFKF